MRITDKIHSLKIPFQIKVNEEIILERFVYVYMIFSDKIYLIDTGVSAAKDVIFSYIKENGRSPEEIEKVFITHAHPDHIGSLKLIKEETACEVLAHRKGRKWIEDTDLQFSERPVPGFNKLVAGSCKIDKLLDEGYTIESGDGLTIKVIYTPGHSGDSLSFYFVEDKILLSGDLLVLPGGIPIYDDHKALRNSLNKIREIDPAVLLSSWYENKEGKNAKTMIDESVEYLGKIDSIVKEVIEEAVPEDKMLFCRKVVEKLGLPKAAENPLAAGSFFSHVKDQGGKND